MKQKISLKKVLFILFFIALSAIVGANKSYADVPEGSLKINVNISNGINNYVSAASHIDYIECEIKTSNGSIPNYDSDFETRNSVTILEDGIIRIPYSKMVYANSGSGKYTVTIEGMPNGDYTINNVLVPINQYWNDYYKMRYLSGDSTFNIDNSETQIEMNLLETFANTYYYYYVDYSGKNPSVTFQLGRNNDKLWKFKYSKDENGDNIYVYDVDGETTDIVVKSRERTIVKDFPTDTNWAFRYISNLTCGGRIYCYTRNLEATTGSNHNIYMSSFDSDGIGMVKAHYIEYNDAQMIVKLNKKDNLGNAVDANFKIYDTQVKKFCGFDYYETYEYNGETYSNVYVINDNLLDEGEEISTINGQAIVIYPKSVFVPNEAYGTGYYYGSSFELIETDADEGLFYNPADDAYVAGFSGFESVIPSLYDGGNLRNALETNPAEFDYSKITPGMDGIVAEFGTVNITNYIKPSVEKVVLNPDGTVDTSCEDEFEFALYDRNFNLVDKIKVKANEKKYFDVERYYREGRISYYPESNYDYYIAEIKRDDYTLEDISSTPMPDDSIIGEVYTFTEEDIEKIEENVYETCYKYTANRNNYAEVKFTDKMIGTEVSGEKEWNDNNNEEEPKEEEPKEETKEEPAPAKEVQTGDKIMICGIVLIISTFTLFVTKKIEKNK